MRHCNLETLFLLPDPLCNWHKWPWRQISSKGGNYLRLLRVAFADTGEGGWQGLRNLRFHHFVESLAHLFFMCLDLAHCRNMSLRDLMMVLDVILERLVVIILNFLLCDATHFVVLLVGLVSIWLSLHARHSVLLRIQRELRMRSFQLRHERRRQRRLPLG